MVVSRTGAVAAIVALCVLGGGVLSGCGTDDGTSSGAASSPAAPAEVASPGAADRAVGAPADGAAGSSVQLDRQVVRSASLELRADDLQAATERARQVASVHGGFVGSERSGPGSASLTLRVAADELDAALAELGRLGEVLRRDLRTEDVTEKSVDLAARIESQRASVERVRLLLDRAVTIGEVVQVESELTWRQAELESLQQRAAALADRTSLADVQLHITGPGAAPAQAAGGFLPGLSAGWSALLTGGTHVLTALGAVLPFAAVLSVPVAGVVLWRHRSRQRKVAADGA